VMVPEVAFRGKDDLESMVVAERGGVPISLRDLATVHRAVGPVEIVREDQAKQVVIRADSRGVSVGQATARAAAAMATLSAPGGVEVAFGGQARMITENRRSLGTILAFALFFSYIVLAIQFESFVQPFLIMIRVPLTLIGVVVALLAADMAIGATVLIGLIILAGNEVNHGVVLVEFINRLRAAGRSVKEAVIEASAIRLRPILMTLSTSVLGLLPLALGIGEGGDMLVPMAVAVIGGLLFSLFMTLVFLPCAYVLLPGRRARVAAAVPDDDEGAEAHLAGETVLVGAARHG
jgi:hydrophobic/amphiphilic exporter-1 (mainly G- bacteria), HAE1 family